MPSTPKDQSVGVLQRPRPRLRPGRHRPDADRSRHARHDGRDQHGADRHRRAGRAGHDQGLPAGAADRAQLRAGRPRRLGDLQQVAADGAARAHDRGRRARGRAGATSSRSSTRRRCAKRCATLDERGDRGADGLAHQRVRERRARAAHQGDRAGGAARRAGLAFVRSRAGDAGVRAHGDDGRELLRAAARADATCTTSAEARLEERAAASSCTSCARTAGLPPRARPRTFRSTC